MRQNMTPAAQPVRPKAVSSQPGRRRFAPIRRGGYHKPMIRLLYILMLAAAPGFAQTAKRAPAQNNTAPVPPGAPTRWPIASLTVEGNRAFTTAQVLAVAKLQVGQIAGK